MRGTEGRAQGGGWRDYSLDGGPVRLGPDGPEPHAGRPNQHLQVRSGASSSILMPLAGVRLLADRDAIALGDGRTVFFSSERLAQVLAFPGADSATLEVPARRAWASQREAGGAPGSCRGRRVSMANTSARDYPVPGSKRVRNGWGSTIQTHLRGGPGDPGDLGDPAAG